MRILIRGRLPENVLHEVTCRHCDTVFEFQTKEAEHVTDLRDGGFLRVKCPLCERDVTKGD
jgi:phage FluMu protein Com